MATEDIKIRLSAEDRASSELKNVRNNIDGVATSAKNTAQRARNLTGSLGGMGRTAGQAGIQVQQLVGQIQMGTNPMVALSQQAADLGFVLGVPLLGAIAGIAASIATVFIPSLFEAKKSVSDLQKETTKLGTTLREIAPTLYGEEAAKGIKRIQELGQKQIDVFNQLTEAEEKAAQSKGMFDKAQQEVNNALKQGLVPNAQALFIANELQTQYQKDASAAHTLRLEYEKLGLELLTTNGQFAQLSGMLDENEKQGKAISRSQEVLVNKFRDGGMAVMEFAKDTHPLQGDLTNVIKFAEETTTSFERLGEEVKMTAMSMDDVGKRGLKGMEDGLVDLINGTKSASEAFKSMANSIINDLIRMYIQRQVTAPLFNAMFGASATTFTTVSGSASPTVGNPDVYFEGGGFTGRGSRSGGVDGKGGFGAILHPNETVIDHSKGQGMGQPVVVNLNISTGVAQTVRTEIANLLPQITNATKAAVVDARRRGGSFAGAFGA